MDTKPYYKYAIFCVIVIVVFSLGIAVATDRCSEEKVLKLETVLTDLGCSEQDEAVIRQVFSDKISECDRAMIAGVCSPVSNESGLTEENSLRLELNNTTVKEKN